MAPKLLCKLSDLEDRQATIRSIGSREFLAYRDGDTVYVCGHTCPHDGAALEEGSVHAHALTCPRHHARFDLRSGGLLDPPALDGIPAYETTVEDGAVFVGRPRGKILPSVSVTSDERVVIIGAGAAGAVCAETLRLCGYPGSVSMITSEPHGPYDRTLLSKGFVAGTVEADWLPLRDPEFYDAIGVEIVKESNVNEIDLAGGVVRCDAGQPPIRFDKLIVATGSRAKKLAVPGGNLPGVFTIRSRRDAERYVEALESSKHPVVIGAGFTGLETAASLVGRGNTPVVIAPDRLPFIGVLGPEIGELVKEIHERNGTRFELSTSVAAIDGKESVERIITDSGASIPADTVVVAVGSQPRSELLRNAGLCGTDEVVSTDEYLRTSDRRVYAVGDIAEPPLNAAGYRYRCEHWATAQRQGRYVAQRICGSSRPYSDVPFFWSDQHGVTLKGVGFIDRNATRTVRRGREREEILVGYFHEGRLIGAAGCGYTETFLKIDHAFRSARHITANQFNDL